MVACVHVLSTCYELLRRVAIVPSAMRFGQTFLVSSQENSKYIYIENIIFKVINDISYAIYVDIVIMIIIITFKSRSVIYYIFAKFKWRPWWNILSYAIVDQSNSNKRTYVLSLYIYVYIVHWFIDNWFINDECLVCTYLYATCLKLLTRDYFRSFIN